MTDDEVIRREQELLVRDLLVERDWLRAEIRSLRRQLLDLVSDRPTP